MLYRVYVLYGSKLHLTPEVRLATSDTLHQKYIPISHFLISCVLRHEVLHLIPQLTQINMFDFDESCACFLTNTIETAH